MKKLIIVRKIHVRIKLFAAPFFKHFRLSLNRKKTCGNEGRDIELNIFKLQLLIY